MIYERCPWGRFRPNLSAKQLTENPLVAFELSDRYSLSVKVLQQYARNIRNNVGFQSPNGRPSVIPVEEEERIAKILKESSFAIAESDYLKLIQDAATAYLRTRTGTMRTASLPSRRWRARFELK